MTTSHSASAPGANATRDEVEADIERTRRQLGDTVEALAAKADVKARLKAQVETTKGRVDDIVRQRRVPITAAGAVVGVATLIVVWRRLR